MPVSSKNIRILADDYRVRAEKYEVLGKLPQSERAFFITGYAPAKDTGRIEESLTKEFTCVIDIEEIKEDEESPTLLSNNSFSASMEGIVESYGLPKRGEFDPTTIMSFFYVFFFGMMLSDAAYGAIIAVACFVLLKKIPADEPGNVSIDQDVYVLRNFHTDLGNSVWRIFWEYCRYCIPEVFRNNDNGAGSLVHSIE